MARNKLGVPEPKLRTVEDVRALRAQRQKRRSKRMMEEDLPAWDYVSVLVKIGPREGESYLAFRKRLAGIQEARRLWHEAWREYNGNMTKCAAALDIQKTNYQHELRQAGLSVALLNESIGKEKQHVPIDQSLLQAMTEDLRRRLAMPSYTPLVPGDATKKPSEVKSTAVKKSTTQESRLENYYAEAVSNLHTRSHVRKGKRGRRKTT